MADQKQNSAAGLSSKLGPWLAERLPGARRVDIDEPERPSGGYSAETLLLTARVERSEGTTEERFVLRREVDEPAVFPVQAPGLDTEVDIQWKAMTAVAESGTAPIAPLLGYEADPAVLGTPFFVMGFVPGDVPREHPVYTQEGFFCDATPDQRRGLVLDGVRVLAQLHSLDWRAAGLDWLVPPGIQPGLERQLQLWEEFAERELAGRNHPAIAEACRRLRAEMPDATPGFSWGDSRLGNIIWQDHRVGCVMDFENVAIAPPEMDLGWWLMFDRCSHEVEGIARLEGEPTREEQAAHYFASAGRDPVDTEYWELFAAMRYSAIVVRVMNRWVSRGDLQEDHNIWLHNPASVALSQLSGVELPTG